MQNIRPDVTVRWRSLKEDDDDLDLTGCLYAWVDCDTGEIAYIGKASRASVAERLQCRSKDAVWKRLAEVGNQGCYVLLGELTLHTYSRLTDALLSDVESLLIMAEQPEGNKQSKMSRMDRLGLRVDCIGRWPGRATRYIDGDARKRKAA